VESGRVHVVGSVNADVTLPVQALPAPGETVLAGDPVRTGGGKGANAAVAAARDGAAVRLVAALGRDGDGARSLADLRADGVDTSAIAVLDDRPTGIATILVDAAGENVIVVAAGANDGLTAQHVAAGLEGIAAEDVCVVGFEVPDAAVLAGVQRAADAGARLLVNPSPVRSLPPELLDARPVVVVNAGELGALGGADALRHGGAPAVVVTLGAKGARVVDGEGEHAVAAFAAEAVDTTGAGDAFTGVLAAALARGVDLRAAARRASAAASRSTERRGARAGMPRRAEVDARLEVG
jgi:ribokinase